MTKYAIELKDIGLSFAGKTLFKNLNIKLPVNGRVLIRGKSGSGKTTLLRIMMGFMQPGSGQVLIESQRLQAGTVWSLRRKLAYVIQDPQLGTDTVDGYLKQVFAFRANRDKTFNRQEALALMKQFHLDENTLEKSGRQLSGGEMQRIAIVTALLLKRKIFLLDEITSALDQAMKEIVADYFQQLEGASLIVVSHDDVWDTSRFELLTL